MPDFTDKPGYSFTPGPPPEASRFLKNKGLKPAFSWEDVEPEEHAIAFSVAKAMDTQVLQTIRDAVQTALDEGQTFAQFKKGLRPELERQGWWGRKELVDPLTGEVTLARLGSPRRLRTIYRANLRSARAAGQWERIERSSDALPYLEYRLGPSERHRPHHASKEHLVLPWDDPFWARWYPPNGWGCKCWVRQISQRQAERLGISESPETPTVERVNRRTGEVRQVPVGIDPGWDRNPGRMRKQAMEDFLATEMEAADPQVAEVIARDIATSWRAARVLDANAPGAVPIAVIPKDVAAAVEIESTVVRMTSEYGEKFIEKKRGVTTETLLRLSADLREGRLLIDKEGEAPNLYVMSRGEDPWIYILKLMRGAKENWVNSMYPLKPSRRTKFENDPTIAVLRE